MQSLLPPLLLAFFPGVSEHAACDWLVVLSLDYLLRELDAAQINVSRRVPPDAGREE